MLHYCWMVAPLAARVHGVPRGARGPGPPGAMPGAICGLGLRGAAGRGPRGPGEFAVSASRVENYVPGVKRTYASGTRI